MDNKKIAIVGSGDEGRLTAIAAMLGAGAHIIHMGHNDPDPFGPVVLKKEYVPTDADNAMAGPSTGPIMPRIIAHEEPHNPLLARPIREVWLPYQELELDNQTLSHYIIDTRDFHGRTGKGWDISKLAYSQLSKIGKNKDFYTHTLEEVKALLSRYFSESGGEGGWRHFALKGVFRANYNDWQMKYIHIYRVIDNEFLVCNGEDFVFNKVDLASPVDLSYLNKH